MCHHPPHPEHITESDHWDVITVLRERKRAALALTLALALAGAIAIFSADAHDEPIWASGLACLVAACLAGLAAWTADLAQTSMREIHAYYAHLADQGSGTTAAALADDLQHRRRS